MPRTQSGASLVVLPGNPQLSAEVRLGQAISEFAQCLDIAGRQAYQKLQVQLTQTGPLSPADVITLTEQLNGEGARRYAAWRPAAGTRIGGFLRRIQQFATFGDILIGGSQNLIASGVWATVRAMLEVCHHHVYFDQISTLLMRLTTSWTITQEFVQHFPRSKELQTYLAEYLIRIVRLCQQILAFSQRSPVMLLASSLFSSFEAEFLPLQQELDQWGLLIEKPFGALTTKTILEGQGALLLESQQRLLTSLSPNQDSFDLIFRRERKRGNCAWLLSDPDYTSWKSATSALLRLTGHLGSGKTVGMANIAADLTGRKGGCALFFCKSDDPRTQTRNSIAGSILHQLIFNNLTACHWDSLDDGCLLPVGTVTVDSVLQMLPSLLPKEQEYVLLIDGLEECPDIEVDDTIQTLLGLQSTFRLSLCLSERSLSHTLPLIGSSFTSVYLVSLNSLSKESELHQYIWSEVQVRNSLRQLAFPPDMETQIAEQLITGAQGMYLWVSLQLEAISPSRQNIITTDETVIDILGNLPNSLPEAFDQALARVSDKRYGMKIFGLVATAAEPLTVDQLKVVLTVQPGNTFWESGKLPHDSRQLVSCCGGTLLEMDEEDGKVRYIHHSVVSYLAKSEPSQQSPLWVSWLEEAEQTMGLICTTYLSYGIFDTRIATTRNVDAKRIVDSAAAAAKSSSPIFTHLIRHIRNGKQPKSVPKGLNILNVLHQAQFSKEDDILKCLLPYAREYWLQHTRFVNTQGNTREYLMWLTIFEEKAYLVRLPWASERQHWSVLIDYALDQSHHCLFQYTIRKVLRFSDLVSFRQLLASKELKKFQIRGPWLDNTIALCIAPGPPINPSLLDYLLTLGASADFSLDTFPDDETGSPGIWKIPEILCQENTVNRMKIGLPLLRTVLRSATDRI
ncbi:vegetative incompatibility protein HET-E-1 [Rhypophila decipiens]|uniref:Vegetative incompatibility protein HET-E-1 n=1 Tax=Rhypophila decipiens TaxID=261697 RepID=A0AAN7B9B0_9PEZI|nr:vegetative incompatibility protein HET-E-1 [Rhypophila decipiens]